MNKKEFIDALASKVSLSKAEANHLIGAVIAVISEALEKGEPVSLPGFGTFEVRERGARNGHNPRTGEEHKIPAIKIAAFKQSAALKGLVNGG